MLIKHQPFYIHLTPLHEWKENGGSIGLQEDDTGAGREGIIVEKSNGSEREMKSKKKFMALETGIG